MQQNANDTLTSNNATADKPSDAQTTAQSCTNETQSTLDERCLRYAQTLARLIRIPTISDYQNPYNEHFRDFHNALVDEFPNLFVACEVWEYEGSLILRWPGKDPDAAPVLFMNHMDVVEPNGQWGAHAPFSGDIADGRVWGRGTLDNKGGLFGMLQAANELVCEGFVPACDIYFLSTNSEETTGKHADEISRAFQERGLRFRFVLDEGGYITHDPLGGADGDFAMIGVGEKSLATLKFIASDAGGHASTPGNNTALVRLARFIAAADMEAKQGFLFRVQIAPTIAQTFKSFANSMTGALGFVFKHTPAFKPLLQLVMPHVSSSAAALSRTTIAFTMAQGSNSYNVLPSQAWVIANMRCSHHQGIEASVAAVTKLAKRFGLEVEILEWSDDTPLTDFHAEGYTLLEEALRNSYPHVQAAPYIMTGMSDCRFMTRVSDVCLRFIPYYVTAEQIESIHGVDENVNISTLASGVDVYKHLMSAL